MEDATTQLEEAGKHKLGRLAEDRHKLRMAALYVDAVSIHEWNRPSRKVSRGQARDFIRDAVNDYSTPYDQRYSNYSLLNKPILNYSRRCRRGTDRPVFAATRVASVSVVTRTSRMALDRRGSRRENKH